MSLLFSPDIFNKKMKNILFDAGFFVEKVRYIYV